MRSPAGWTNDTASFRSVVPTDIVSFRYAGGWYGHITISHGSSDTFSGSAEELRPAIRKDVLGTTHGQAHQLLDIMVDRDTAIGGSSPTTVDGRPAMYDLYLIDHEGLVYNVDVFCASGHQKHALTTVTTILGTLSWNE